MSTVVPSIEGFTGLRRIGHGGFSVVFEATQVDLGRQVAIKVLNLDASDEAARRRFERECRAIGALSGTPGVVDIHQSAVTDDGRMAIVMELMTESLDHRVASQGPLTPREVCEIGVVLAGALAEAHALDIVHRDIKPGNVLLSKRGEVALSDFGIAMVAEIETSSETEASLSPPFAAPERFSGSTVDERRADVYALGATLYFAATSRPPFGSSADGGISGLIGRILHDPVPLVERAEVPEALGQLLASMMAKEPSERPGDFAELGDRFAALVGDTTGPAGAPSGVVPPDEAAPPSEWWAAGQSVASGPVFAGVGPDGAGSDGQVSVGGPDPVVSGHWPTATDYVAAVQDPASVHADQLRPATLTRGPLGMPLSASGQSTVVFHFDGPDGPLAARCFTRVPVDGRRRYLALTAHLERQPQHDMVPAEWVDDAITVGTQSFPMVVMPWVPGVPLNEAAGGLLDQPSRLRDLADAWLEVLDRLRDAEVAHGDLQHGNVLVDSDLRIRLIDLDGVWVPDASLPAPQERGHPNFQHPRRDESWWGRELDTFSGFVVYLSLLALAADPALWSSHMGENLVLLAEDFAAPGGSATFAALRASSDPGVRELTATLAELCASDRPPTGDVRALISGQTPRAPDDDGNDDPDDPDEITLRRSQIDALLAAEDSSLGPQGGEWWEDVGAPDDESEPAAPVGDASATAAAEEPRDQPKQESRKVFALLGRSSPLSGLVAGALAGAIGAIVGGIVSPPSVDNFESAGVLALLVSALTAGLVASWPHLTARAWAKGAGVLAAGVVVGALACGATLLAVDPYFQNELEADEPVGVAAGEAAVISDAGEVATGDPVGPVAPAGATIVSWVAVAAVAGTVSGAMRSLRGVASGLLGGVVGGLLGGALFWVVVQPIVVQSSLIMDGTDPSTVAAIAATAGLIGLAVGTADRVSRRASLTVIEGRLRGRTINVDRAMTTIGSSASCAVVLRGDPAVSPLHARLRLDHDGASVEPVSPVKVNGAVLLTESAIAEGDVLQIGGSFIRYEGRTRAVG